MRILLVVDRGNSGCKFLPVIDEAASEPFKISSVTRKIEVVDDGIKIEKTGSVFLCGDSAMGRLSGEKYTPLDSNDKIRDLSVAVAAALIRIAPDGGPIELSLAVSSPIFYKGIEQEILKEMSKLDEGFSYNGCKYSILLERVGGFQEGVIFLENNSDFNGVIDLGQGTLLAGVRYPDYRGVTTLPLSDGSVGGCNLILQSLLKDDRFLKAVKNAGFASAPSFEKLSSLLSRGEWEVREVDFRKFLKPHLKLSKQRIENAAQSVRAEIRNASPYDKVTPRIALIGGGSSLLQGVLGEALERWCDRHSLVMFTDSPDYQTVLQIYESIKQDSSRLTSLPAPIAVHS
ncbi:MAG: hypothetical protein ABG776_06635 [Cyanobacteria bacterium J06555_13]